MGYEYEQRRRDRLMEDVLNLSDESMVEADDEAESFSEIHLKVENCSNNSNEDDNMGIEVPDYESARIHKVPNLLHNVDQSGISILQIEKRLKRDQRI